MKMSVILKDKKRDKTLVMIRLSDNGQRRYITVGEISPSDWDDKKCRSKKRDSAALMLNSSIEQQLNELQRKMMRLRALNMRVTLDRVLEKEIRANNLSEYIAALKDEYELKGKYHSVKLFKVVLKWVEKHDVNIGLIDDKWCTSFMNMMQEANVSNTSMYTYIRVCKITLNKCVRNKIIPKNPMDHIAIKKDAVFKSKLSPEELVKMKNAAIGNKSLELAMDTFMTAIYMYGARFMDVVTARRNQIKDDRIYLVHSKTGKIHNIKVTEPIKQILIKYPTRDYILPWLEGLHFNNNTERLNKIQYINRSLNRQLRTISKLAGIEKTVTMHVARHTFAVLANNSNVKVTDIQKLLNHASLNITQTYLNELGIDEYLDNEAAKVFDSI
jgi:integrase/recombinase XerD